MPFGNAAVCATVKSDFAARADSIAAPTSSGQSRERGVPPPNTEAPNRTAAQVAAPYVVYGVAIKVSCPARPSSACSISSCKPGRHANYRCSDHDTGGHNSEL